jgi:hypothetical protein
LKKQKNTIQYINQPVTMPKVEVAQNKSGDFFVDYEEKVFEDVKAEPGQKALVTFHTVAFEGSIGLVNILTPETGCSESLHGRPSGHTAPADCSVPSRQARRYGQLSYRRL